MKTIVRTRAKANIFVEFCVVADSVMWGKTMDATVIHQQTKITERKDFPLDE
jgi:hypothetical protein